MDNIIEFRLSVKHSYGSDHIEELKHIDKYFSKYINSHVEIIVTELDPSSNKDFIVEINGKEIEDPSISNIVDIVNRDMMQK